METLGNYGIKYSRRPHTHVPARKSTGFYFVHYANVKRKILSMDEEEN
jgi:hypothetical protein